MGVTSRMLDTWRPAPCRERMAASRPLPGPRTSTSTWRRPWSLARRVVLAPPFSRPASRLLLRHASPCPAALLLRHCPPLAGHRLAGAPLGASVGTGALAAHMQASAVGDAPAA